MPRTITTVKTVYTFEELSPQAQQRAVEQVASKRVTDWWGEHDNDDIRHVIVAKLAEKLDTPGWADYGVDDFPGIPGVKLDGFDLDRGQSVDFKGTLNRTNAPALPWAGGIEQVELDYGRFSGTRVYVNHDVYEGDPAYLHVAVELMEQAVRNALRDAWKAGYDESEHKGSEEYAREYIEANEREFDEDGNLC